MLCLWFCAVLAHADSNFYCTATHSFIHIGMTADQVITNCGPPQSKNESGQTIAQKIPVTTLIYNSTPKSTFNMGADQISQNWGLQNNAVPVAFTVNIIDSKVASFQVSGSSSNSISLCNGRSINVGDDINAVYSACGNPSAVNQSFITKKIPKSQNPEVWNYQIPYQASFSLTFINGELQSINN